MKNYFQSFEKFWKTIFDISVLRFRFFCNEKKKDF
jgi:hypothetical protein